MIAAKKRLRAAQLKPRQFKAANCRNWLSLIRYIIPQNNVITAANC